MSSLTATTLPPTTPPTWSGITAKCPQPYAVTPTLTGWESPFGLHLSWQVYSTDTGQTYQISLYRYRTYDDANQVLATMTSAVPQADFGPMLTLGWLYRAEIRVPGVDDGSGLRVACIDLANTQPATTP